MWVLCCRWRMWQIRQQTGVCEPLMPDVVAPEAHQYDCSYVREFSGPTFNSLHKNLAWWLVTQRTSKKQNCQNWVVGTCTEMGACPEQYSTWKPFGHINVLTDTGAMTLGRALQDNKSLEETQCLPIKLFTTCTNSHTIFHSLEHNTIGHSGASALADTLRVNQRLKTLK